jgi:predicted PurR-regulated permease PerM
MASDRLTDAAFARHVLIVAGAVALALALWYLVDVLLLIFGAVLIAVLLHALADPITRRTPLSNAWALAAATLGVLLAIGLAAWLFGAEVRTQAAELADRLPEAWRSFEQRFGTTELGERLIGRVQDAAPGAGSVVSGLASVATSFVSGLADLLLIVFGASIWPLSPAFIGEASSCCFLVMVPVSELPAHSTPAAKRSGSGFSGSSSRWRFWPF